MFTFEIKHAIISSLSIWSETTGDILMKISENQFFLLMIILKDTLKINGFLGVSSDLRYKLFNDLLDQLDTVPINDLLDQLDTVPKSLKEK